MSDSSTQPRVNKQSGQGIIEYILILILVSVVVIVMLTLLAPAIGNVWNNLTGQATYTPCQQNSTSFQCYDFKVNQCLQSEKYTKQQCIDLVGGGNGK